MAGHNQWSKVKRLKGALDAEHGKLFRKLAQEITLAAKTGGNSPDGNLRLRGATQAARSVSTSTDNIERAIRTAVEEESRAAALDESVREGYGPDGGALVTEAATENRNRTARDLRANFSRKGGNLATSGAVLFQIKHKSHLTLPLGSSDEERVFEAALAAGAEGVSADEEHHLTITPHDQLHTVDDSLKRAGLEPDSVKLTYLPENTVPLTGEAAAAQFLRLAEALEDNEDVHNVHANADISEALLVTIGG